MLRPGQKKKRTAQKIQDCKELILHNRNIGLHQLSRSLSMSYGTVRTLVHKDLGMKKKASKMVPHQLTASDRAKRIEFCTNFVTIYGTRPQGLKWLLTTDESWFYVRDPGSKIKTMAWLCRGEDHPQVVMRDRNSKKVMFIPFFDARGLLYHEFFINQTVNKEVFMPLIRRVHEKVKTRRGSFVWNNRRDYRLHMDNALAHRSYLVQGALRVLDWPVLKHPAYSLDLSPADFFLFPYLKRRLRGINFRNTENLIEAIETEISLITASQWRACFSNWVDRCRRCLAFRGAYFEGMKNVPQ